MSNNADQASKLRSLFNKGQGSLPASVTGKQRRARVIAVSGGKGGVGKTNIAANLSIALAALGKRVALFDADYALANVDILLGINPQLTLEHVLDGSRNVGEILIDGPGGIKIVPAASGVQQLSRLGREQEAMLQKALQMLELYFDVMVLDTAAGISDEVMTILQAAGEVIVVTNPEPPAFVDSYALIKNLLSMDHHFVVRILVNQVTSEKEALSVFDRISKTVVKFLKAKVDYLGYVLEDANVKKAVRLRKAFYIQFPGTGAATCIQSLAVKLLKQKTSSEEVFSQRLRKLMIN